MSLFNKVRVLVGALVHKPFMTKPEKVELDGESRPPQESASQSPRAALEGREAEAADTDRVADLIAEQRRDGG